MRVLFFGDSITQGFFDLEGGWVTRLRKQYDQIFFDAGADPTSQFPLLFNLGISANLTKDVLARFSAEAEAREYMGETLAFVFAIGTNDTCFWQDKHESEPEIYTRQLAELVAQARMFSDRILFVGLQPATDALLNPLPQSTTGRSFSTDRLKMFDDALKQFCAQEKLPVVDVFSAFVESGDPDALLLDGLHPNAKGHELIASLVKPQLDKLL